MQRFLFSHCSCHYTVELVGHKEKEPIYIGQIYLADDTKTIIIIVECLLCVI